jgi:DNA-binding SARP family transcriptional activator
VGDELTFPVGVVAGLPQDDDPQSLLRGRGAGGKVSTPPVVTVRTNLSRKESEYLWPVRIYTLGKFFLVLNGQAACLDPDAAPQPIELLKVLVALGGREISISRLASALWPDDVGEVGRNAIDAALCRLRNALGEEGALVWKYGRISLDSRYCWVDAWDFKRTLTMARRILTEDSTGKEARRLELLSARLLELYRGHFLSGEATTSWSVSPRERLRADLVHYLLDVGRYWEARGFWDKAIVCYQRGLEFDELIEVFYQRLMVCWHEAHRISEGLAVYQRCREVLSSVLGLQPAPETEALHHALMGATAAGKHTA